MSQEMTPPMNKAAPSLDPMQRADTAVRRILGRQLDALRANIDGVIEDLDTEALHDLRVATRRTRSALTTARGVLPETVLDDFAPGFKWLGAVTGPCRDLDVHLIEMESFRRRLAIAEDSLGPVQQLLEQTRRDEHRRVCECLRSARFRRLIDGWDEFLHSDTADATEPPNARRPVIDVAGNRIHKAYRRLVKRGTKLADDSPTEAYHRLRIDAKKLRYPLEFFAELYPKKTVRQLVKELKELQDILGGFNDMVVQRARLAELTDRLTASGEASPETETAMGRLANAMAERQEEYRRAFAETLAAFAGTENRRLYRITFR